MNPAETLDLAAIAHPDHFSIRFEGTVLTVAESARLTRQVAEALVAAGVRAGDRVMLVAHNSPAHLLLHVACARLGAIFTPISYRYTAPELARLRAFLAPRVVIADPASAHLLSPAGFVLEHFSDRSAPFNHSVPLDHTVPLPGATSLPGATPLARATKAGWRTLDVAHYPGALQVAGDAPDGAPAFTRGDAALLLTSGSAGTPKAALLTHEQLWWGSQNLRWGFHYSPADTELVTAPLSHIGGLNGTTLDIFAHGGCVVVVRDFDAGVVVDQLARSRAAIMFAVPTMYEALLARPDFTAAYLPAFRLPLVGGAAVHPHLLAALTERGFHPINVYGMTETSSSIALLPASFPASKCGALGIPFPFVQVRLVDPDSGQPSDAGEVQVCGPSVVNGYWHDPATTASSFIDGWLRTGDLAHRDIDGVYWSDGRMGNQINTGGEKVSPEEVEEALAGFPGMAACAVTGIDDPLWGQRVALVAVMQPGAAAPTLDALRTYAARTVANYKLPRACVVVDHLPLNANGKVNRKALPALFSH